MSRGCGDTRVDGGLYICVGLSGMGSPIETFILDPARPWAGGVLRAPMLAEREVTEEEIGILTGDLKPGDKVNDALMWVGAESYPFAPDFIEEARVLGISKRIPREFPVEHLTPFDSRLILIHPKGIPEFAYELPPSPMCLKPKGEAHRCTFDLWGLSALENLPPKHELTQASAVRMSVHIPCGRAYSVVIAGGVPRDPAYRTYQPAAFAAFYITHFEYVKADGQAPVEMIERYRSCQWDFRVVEE